jgi:hypothetical protein
MKLSFALGLIVLIAGMVVGCGSENNNNPNQISPAPIPYNPAPPVNPDTHPVQPLPAPVTPGTRPPMMPGPGMPPMPPGPGMPHGPMMPPPPMPYDPNIRFLPPHGAPIGYQQCEHYFQQMQCPHSHQPIFQPQMAAPWARRCHDGRFDLRRYNEMFYYFASIQVQQSATYHPLFNGHTVVRLTTAIMEQHGGAFDIVIFRRHYDRCLRSGYVGVQAIQQAFYSMNIRINVQEYVI